MFLTSVSPDYSGNIAHTAPEGQRLHKVWGTWQQCRCEDFNIVPGTREGQTGRWAHGGSNPNATAAGITYTTVPWAARGVGLTPPLVIVAGAEVGFLNGAVTSKLPNSPVRFSQS